MCKHICFAVGSLVFAVGVAALTFTNNLSTCTYVVRNGVKFFNGYDILILFSLVIVSAVVAFVVFYSVCLLLGELITSLIERADSEEKEANTTIKS